VEKLCFDLGRVFPIRLLRLDRHKPKRTHSEGEEQSFQFFHYVLLCLFVANNWD
jgi:hypothetical protein